MLCRGQEAEIRFPPTYRMEKGKADQYSNKKHQNPSYTDRVLYRSLPRLEDGVTTIFYGADFSMIAVRLCLGLPRVCVCVFAVLMPASL